MAKRKPDPYELQTQRRADCRRNSATISERFPNVQSLKITAIFKEPDRGQDPAPRVLDCNHGSKAHFEIECPHRASRRALLRRTVRHETGNRKSW
jgi:hypothetical protein